MMNKIIFQNVTKKYDDKLVLDHMSLDFPASGKVCILGPSGVGKTTVFNLLLGLEKPQEGIVRTDGRISAVFQEDRLLPWESVLSNVMFPCRGKNDIDKTFAEEKAIRILEELGLENEYNSFPGQLSGGMARRVSIARALMVDADIYLMDEPTKGLDDTTRRLTLNVIQKYTKNRLLIMITHNQEETAGSYVISLS